MSEVESERGEIRMRSLLWMEALWEGRSTFVREEQRKEEVLRMLHELAQEARRSPVIREYVPWEPLW